MRGSIWRAIVLIGLGIGLGLFLVELLLRLLPGLLPPEIQPRVAQKSWLLASVGLPRFVAEYRQLWEPDEFLRERMKPGLDTIILGNPEYPAWSIRTDSFDLGPVGFRDTLPAGPPYALVLGDSFGFGVGVEQEEIWLERLERETGLPFLNMSQVGASSLQEARIYARYGRRFPAKVVFWMFFQNDLKDNVRFAGWRDQAASIQTEPFLRPEPCKGPHHRLSKRYSIAYELLIYWQRACEYVSTPPTPTYRDRNLNLTFCLDHDICNPAVQSRILASGWPLAQSALIETRRLVEEQGAELIILIVPSKEQVYWEQFQRAASFSTDYDIDQLVRPVDEFCRQAGVRCINLTGAFRREADRGRQLYFPVDIHWNADGHRLVAEVVKVYLREADLLP